ncbi:MAG: DUF4922 domain-containing protein [Bacteroidales bacterium]|nr:DUF4922 domain-containing protein [Candidatus Cacconaster merdequi]
MSHLANTIENMFSRELELHGRAFLNYQALATVEKKSMLSSEGFPALLFFNPARVASVMAKVDEETLRHRKCFLCPDGLEEKQLTTLWDSPAGRQYWIRVNPFPIFDRHFTISVAQHERQQIAGHYDDMLSLAGQIPEYCIFYNGPMCGASAPDHMHFQAVPSGSLPMERMVREGSVRRISVRNGVTVSKIEKYVEGSFVLQGGDPASMHEQFSYLVSLGEIQTEREWEPRMNILSWYADGKYTTVVYFRAESRPQCFFEKNEAQRILISPASVEMSGVAIVSSRDSFEKLDPEKLGQIIKEVSLDSQKSFIMEQKLKREQALLSVGIFSLPEVSFCFNAPYTFEGRTYEGPQKATVKDGKVLFDGKTYDTVQFAGDGTFTLIDVIIGVNFHWERRENQTFQGTLKLIVENGCVTAINIIGIEDYLYSVISSEMSATASKNLLKAHAVISRSWLLAQIVKNKTLTACQTPYSATTDTEDELIKWYDREDHVNFDVCADDHCQRYQGIVRSSVSRNVREAIDETWGEVLKYDGEICDARFSKCCGGVMEEFQYAWEPKKFDYLVKRADAPDEENFPDLTVEENARKWILSSPEAFCNTSDAKVLSQVLNTYDQETTHFYRWDVEYSAQELSELVKERSGVDYGEITDLIPVARGTSGRLWKLKIVGTKKTKIIGKELEIRRTLSKSHLYSSAFVVEKKDGKFLLHGAGWGHGVGLCQIGAAVMGEKGYSYDKILGHYFPHALIETQY